MGNHFFFIFLIIFSINIIIIESKSNEDFSYKLDAFELILEMLIKDNEKLEEKLESFSEFIFISEKNECPKGFLKYDSLDGRFILINNKESMKSDFNIFNYTNQPHSIELTDYCKKKLDSSSSTGYDQVCSANSKTIEFDINIENFIPFKSMIACKIKK